MRKLQLPAPIIILLSAITALSVIFFSIYLNWWNLGIFWDLNVYTRAANDGLTGQDPYRDFTGLKFVYHPVVVNIFTSIHSVVHLSYAMSLIYLYSMLFLFTELSRCLKITLGERFSSAQHIAMPVLESLTVMVVGVTTIASGNLTGYLHFGLFAFLLRNLRLKSRVSSVPTMVLIGALAALKPYFLAYILLTFLDTQSITRKVSLMGTAVGVFTAIWASGLVFYPEQMQVFLDNLAGLQSNNSADIGIGFYRITQELGMPKLAGLAVHSIISALLLVWIWSGIQRLRLSLNTGGLILALGYFGLTLINPRVKEYDLGPALLFLFVFWNAYSRTAQQVFSVLATIFVLPIIYLYVTL